MKQKISKRFIFLSLITFLTTPIVTSGEMIQPQQITAFSATIQKFETNGVRIRREGFREEVFDLVTLKFNSPEDMKEKKIEIGVVKVDGGRWSKIGSAVEFSASREMILNAATSPGVHKLFEGALKKINIQESDPKSQ